MTVFDPSASLDRHHQHREDALPTVSVLVGPIGLAVREGQRWAEGRGRPVVLVDDPRLDAMVDAWADRLAAGRDLLRDALVHLSRPLGDHPDDLGSRIARMTSMELSVFLDSTPMSRDGAGAEAACRWIIERNAAGESPAAPGLAARLGAMIARRDGAGPREQAAAALESLIPPGTGPVLLAARLRDRPAGMAWVESTARSLARLALIQPRLTLILAIEPGDLDAYIRLAPESREKALIRSGIVPVRPLDGEEIGRRLTAEIPGVVSQIDGPMRRLVDDGASAGLAELFLDVARATSGPAGPGADDRARSAAERFLFERLASLPQTAGMFELNAALDIPFGPGRTMEVDLLSRDLGLAIEIDGYYHFQDEDAYRRDRRKDVALQGRGYMVLRVLAADVVRRLEEVLDMILAAVASRRSDPDASNRDETS